MPKTLLLLLLIPAGAAFLFACGDQRPISEVTPQAVITVDARDNKFSPRVIEVGAGTTVTWSFRERALHNVVGEGWKSENQNSGTYEHTFDRPGVYDYVCTLHSNMDGRVIVTE